MKPKIFIDAGYYVGKALEYYAPFIDESWLVCAFEPNTELNVEETSGRFPFNVSWVQKAVWISDGEADFTIGGRNDASHLTQLHREAKPTTKTSTVDFSRFVSELPDNATICCSMDIEGAEFPVLRKMIKDGTASRLKLLDIEFHSRLIDGENGDTVSQLRQQLESLGVLVKLKIEVGDA